MNSPRIIEGSISVDTIKEEVIGKLYQWGILKPSETVTADNFWINPQGLNNETVVGWRAEIRTEGEVKLKEYGRKSST